MEATRRELEALASNPVVGPQARAHLGLIHFHRNRLRDSVAMLSGAARAASDPFVQNLAWLIAGLAHEAQNHPDEAAAAFESAVVAVPTAKASATTLAANWFLAGRREEASELLDRAYALHPPTLDPWQHVADLMRFMPDWLAEMRASVSLPPAPVSAMPQVRFDVVPPAAQSALDNFSRPADWIAPSATQALPTFRSRGEAVLVDGSVLQRNSPVEGLGASDFEILDNGVPQRVASVALETLPIDLTMVVDYFDVEPEVGPFPWQPSYGKEQRRLLKADVTSIAALLTSTDRLRIIEVENEPIERLPIQSASGARLPAGPRDDATIGRMSYGRSSALYDAVATAIMRHTPPGRRHLVLAFTDGVDDASVLTRDKLVAIARRADAVMHLFKRKTSHEVRQEQTINRLVAPSYPALLWPAEPSLVGDLARTTGGSIISSLGGSKYDDLSRIIVRLRQSYLLQYQPTGVSPGGWHQIEVRVLRQGRFDIRARRGYWGG
jgi:tetratricopeptide (TPR) repeat protein